MPQGGGRDGETASRTAVDIQWMKSARRVRLMAARSGPARCVSIGDAIEKDRERVRRMREG